MTLKTQFSFKRISEHHGSLIAHGPIKVTQCSHSERWSGPSISLRQSTKNRTAQWRQERVLKTAGAQRRKPQGTKPIEEPRWAKHWYLSSEVIANWNEQWVKTSEWGKKWWTHTSLVDYFMATRTFQTWFHRCSRNRRINQMLRCQRSDLGHHRPSRPSTGRAKVTDATSRFLFTSTGEGRQDKFERVGGRQANEPKSRPSSDTKFG